MLMTIKIDIVCNEAVLMFVLRKYYFLFSDTPVSVSSLHITCTLAAGGLVIYVATVRNTHKRCIIYIKG